MIIKNILLTGSSGFIGSITKKYLKQKNYNVINLSIRTHESDREFLNYINNSIKEQIEEESVNKIDCLIHIGWGDTDNPWSDYHLEDNVKNSKLLFKFAEKMNIKKIIFCGSMNEYGDVSGSLNERTISGVIETNYAKAKFIVTEYGLKKFNNADISFFSVRPFYVYGNVFNKESLINQLIEAYNFNKKIDLTSCKALRDYVHVNDVAVLFEKIVQNDNIETGIYNIGSGNFITVEFFVESFWRELGGDINLLKFGAIPDRKEQAQPPSFSDNSKIKQNFNWTPEISLKEGLKLMVKKI